MPIRYNRKNIRDFFTEGFTEGELRSLVFYEQDLKEFYDKLPTTSKDEIIRCLIECAERKLLLGTLLRLARVHNPAMYEKHQPYYFEQDEAAILTIKAILDDETNKIFTERAIRIVVSKIDPEEARLLDIILPGLLKTLPEFLKLTNDLQSILKQSRRPDLPLSFSGKDELITLFVLPIVIVVLNDILAEIGENSIDTWRQAKEARQISWLMMNDKQRQQAISTLIKFPEDNKQGNRIIRILAESLPSLLSQRFK